MAAPSVTEARSVARGEFTVAVDFATVALEAAAAKLGYAGTTRAGGAIKAVMTLSHGAHGVLKVDAVAAQRGTYAGFAPA